MSLFSSNDEHFCTPFALHNKQNTSRRGQIENTRLEPENEYGNVEYKLRLTDPTPERVERLVTQLKWRIREGNGEAILFLGVKDNGLFVGLTNEEVRLSLQTLERMAAKIGAKMTVVNERIVENDDADENQANFVRNKSAFKGYAKQHHLKENSFSHQRTGCNQTSGLETNKANRKFTSNSTTATSTTSTTNVATSKILGHRKPVRKVIQVLVKRKTHDISEELRVAVLGPTESGKSSLLGVLSHGEYDNGRGSARLNLFRHRHEIRSGHTSSISQEVFGYNCHGQPLTYSSCLTTEEIIESSSRIVTLVDLAGHQRYLGTTLFGLGSYSPDVVLLVISVTTPITCATTDHISLALGMEKSLAIIINKNDLAKKEVQENFYNELLGALHSIHPNIVPFRIAVLEDAATAASQVRGDSRILPIFFVSCVTGAGLDYLYAFFYGTMPMLNSNDLNAAINQPSELQVDETFEVPGIGTVVSGLMIEGTIREGDEMLLGPDDQGNFSNVSIVSLQRHKIPCNFARAGQKCTMAITANNIKVRKGMVMKELDLDWSQNFSTCLQFKAKIKFITEKHHKLSPGSQVSVYVGNVKQTCTIRAIELLKLDNSWLIDFKLTKRPEYIREGSRLIIRHADINGIGVVCSVVTMSHYNAVDAND